MRRIVTHTRPDGDAIASSWLAATYLFPGENVAVDFVPRLRPGQPFPAADCIVDIGRVHDPERLIFDHKPPAFADRNATCATRLVWERLLALGRRVGHLEALVRVVHEGDQMPAGKRSNDMARSKSEGFHARLAKVRKEAVARGGGDHQVYEEMKGWLDLHDREERLRCGPAGTPTPNGPGRTRADTSVRDARVGGDGPQPVTSGADCEASVEGTARGRPSGPAVPPPGPDRPAGDDALQALELLLREYRQLCERDATPALDAEAHLARRLAAIRRAIGDRLDRSAPGSKAAGFLRGLRVLLEAERIEPGHLASRRREAEGWSTPLSLANGSSGRESIRHVAPEYGVDEETLAGEARLAEAVELIARNCEVGAIGPLLTPGGRLREPVVLSIARKGPERQRYAMAEAARGRAPLARPAEGVWPMDTRDFAKVPGRLGRALGLLDRVVAGVASTGPGPSPDGGVWAEIRLQASAIAAACEALRREVEAKDGGAAIELRRASAATRGCRWQR